MRRCTLVVLVLAGNFFRSAETGFAGFPATFEWKRLGREAGLPVLKTLSVEILEGVIYAGTSKGLFRKAGQTPFKKVDLDEIPETAILSLKADRKAMDLWVGTMHGLARVNQGRVDVYTQLNSGLLNDVVHGLDFACKHVWIATEAGVSRFEPSTGRWESYNGKNTPMKEIWCHGIAASEKLVYVAVWGGGVMEYSYATGSWKNTFDPDGEFEKDLVRNDGLPSVLISNIDYDGKTAWASSYFGVAGCNGCNWLEWFEDSGEGLPSNFVNHTRSDLNSPGRTRPQRVWACTDRGLGCFDGKIWTHEICDIQAHSVSFEGDTVVVATDNGVFVGTPQATSAKTGRDAGSGTVNDQAKTGSRPESVPHRQSTGPRGPNFRPHHLYLPKSFDPDEDYTMEIPIGLLGYDEGHPSYYLSIQAERAMQLAIEEENDRGGYNGTPYRLAVERMASLWGPASNGAVAFAYRHRALFYVGPPYASDSQTALWASLKTEMPMISTYNTEQTQTKTRIPWHLRVNSDDRQYVNALARHVVERLGHKRVGLFRVNGAYGRFGVIEFADACQRLGHPLVLDLRHEQGSINLTRQVETIKKANLDAVVIRSDAVDAGNIVRALKDGGFTGPIFGADRVVYQDFLKTAGEAAEGVVAVTDYDPTRSDPELWRFQTAYMKQFWERPEACAARTYAGMRIAFDTIRKVGPRRRPFMEELLKLEGQKVPTVLGTLELDSRLDNVAPVVWVRVVKGRFHYSNTPPTP